MRPRKTALCLLLIAAPLVLLAWAGPIESPQIAPGPKATEEGIHKTIDFLTKKADFREGNFINEYSFMAFGGSEEAINEAIRTLVTDAALDVTVAFAHIDDPKTSFTISQDALRKTTNLTINVDHPEFDLTKIVIEVGAGESEELDAGEAASRETKENR